VCTPIQNNFTRALLHVSTSGTPYVLQMNFSVDVTKFSAFFLVFQLYTDSCNLTGSRYAIRTVEVSPLEVFQ